MLGRGMDCYDSGQGKMADLCEQHGKKPFDLHKIREIFRLVQKL
jgi:hypothetical protein